MSKRVLIAPLDWGLGHTARCIPIIQHLLQQGHTVVFAGTKKQFDFVTLHQINIKHIELFSYEVKYAKRIPQWLKISTQINKLKDKVKAEHIWLNNLLKTEKFDVIVSDNRYGLHSKKVHSIFIGHQLSIQSPLLQKKLNIIHASYINKFNECWIPDDDQINLSGQLSVNNNITIPTKRIGILSRFKQANTKQEKKFDVLIILSGTEPQRSVLEEKLINQLALTKYTVALVRGSSEFKLNHFSNIKHFGLLNSDELQTLVENSETIVCRSGYSSIMDIIGFNKKLILIPTPGQTEQEYLAIHLKKTHNINYLEQSKLNTLVGLIDKLEASKIDFTKQKLDLSI